MFGRIVGGFLGLIVVLIAAIFVFGYEPDIPVTELEPKYMNEASQYVTLRNGLKVHVRDEGPAEARPLVLVHGFSASLHTWGAWAERLKDRYRVISLDLAGHGLTGPHPTHDYSMSGQALLVEEVLEKMGVESYAIAGSSMGGFVSWVHTLENPEKVTGLILVGASGYEHPEREPSGVFLLMETPGVRELLKFITPRAAIVSTMGPVYANSPVVDDELIDRYHELILREGNREAIGRIREIKREYHLNNQLKSMNTPTLILHGRLDPLVPVKDGYQFDKDIPNSTLHVYENVGHIPMEEIPDRTVADLVAFLEGPASVSKSMMGKAMDAVGNAANSVMNAVEEAYEAAREAVNSDAANDNAAPNQGSGEI
ncbi:MAG: alpha/beta fold hydrolase [Alphaproteobacteria bacterium]